MDDIAPTKRRSILERAQTLRSSFQSPSALSLAPTRGQLESWGNAGRSLPERHSQRLLKREENLREAQQNIKGGHIEIDDVKQLLLYLQWDAEDGTGPEPRHVDDAELLAEGSAVFYEHKSGAFVRARGGPSKTSSDTTRDDVVEDRAMIMERFLNAYFMAVQGALAGYSAGVASVEYALDDNSDLVEHYGRVSNLFRRWAYLLSSMAFVGALNKFQVAHQDRHAWKNLEPLARVEMRTLVVFYFGALTLTLLCSSIDVSLATNFNDDDRIWQDTFTSPSSSLLMSLGAWRSAVWARFFLAAAGWLLSCRRHDRILKLNDRAHRECARLRAELQAANDL